MLGTILNVLGILIGGVAGLGRRTGLSAANEARVQVVLAALTVFFGLRLTWLSVNGSFGQIARQLLIVLLALMLGRLAGRWLRLQEVSNGVGRQARQRLAGVKPGDPNRLGEGFKTCSALFCASPLGVVGALVDGLSFSRYFYPLAIKGVLEGLASASFAPAFGGGVLLSALPVLAVQGTLGLLGARVLEPFLAARGLLDSVNAVAGLLIFCVALVMLGLKRIELANYLPSLLMGPLLTWCWR